MLSRVADALFWMSRYLERAECVARLLDVCFHLELDLRGVLAAGPRELHWTSLAAILQEQVPTQGSAVGSPQATISRWLSFDLDNPNSIMACITRVRTNARGIRGKLSNELWRELNKLYWQLRDPEFSARAAESPHDFYQAVVCGSHLFQGVCDATMTHDEGWQFTQLGRYLERADKTLHIIDIQYHLLQELTDPADLSLSNLLWAGVLRGCSAYQAYQMIQVGRVDPERVVEFLLLHRDSPRSVYFSLEAAARALEEIEGPVPGHGASKAARLLGRVCSDLQFVELEQLFREGLHTFLRGILERCAQVGRAIQDEYFYY
jgi:uncharacterized alpha-E superfamily protein